jgi:hypothetical protein
VEAPSGEIASGRPYHVDRLSNERQFGPFTAEMNMGGMKYDSYPFTGEKTIWGTRVQYRF